MSRVSRRQRAHEEISGKRKLRNLFAFLFGAFALGLAGIFVYANWPEGETKIHVLIQTIQTSNYFENDRNIKTRRHAIPFQDLTSNQLHEAFSEFTNTVVAKVEKIQGLDEKIGLSEDTARAIDDDFISFLYVNGNIKLADENVVWIYPDQDNPEMVTYDVKEALQSFATSPGKLKVVFLDAGHYSWCPSHPNRVQDPFQERLAEIIKGMAQETNLWIVLSHGPNEISLNCSPEKMSIFGLAIRETLASLKSTASVMELFRGIYERCAFYSTNFGGEALQNPMLFRAGFGLIEELDEGDVEINFSRSLISTLEEQESEKKKRLLKFRNSFTADTQGKLAGFEDWLGKYTKDIHNQPVVSMFNVENFTEPGQSLEKLKINREEYSFEGLPPETKKKNELVSAFRRNCIDLGLQLRVANLLQLWEKAQRNILRQLFESAANNYEWTPLINYDDDQLATGKVTTGNALQLWNQRHEKLINLLHGGWILNSNNFGVPETAIDDDGDLVLTPIQAELLGVITQRLLPYCKSPIDGTGASPTPGVNSQNEEPPQRVAKFQLQYDSYQLNLDLPIAAQIPKYSPKQITQQSSWQEAFEKFDMIVKQQALRGDASTFDDTLRRVRLAAFGSEDTLEISPPKIGVYAGEPKINFQFEDKLALYAGHNFFKGEIMNSAGNYQISAVLENENGGGKPGVEYYLFKPDRLFSTEANSAYLETSGEFIFYVFARPAVEQRPDRIRFNFSARALSGENQQQLNKSVNLTFDDDPLISVKTVRDVGSDDKESQPVGMMPWRTNAVENFSLPAQPLQLHSLANLKSKFEFQFVNNSSVTLDRISIKLHLLSNEFFGDIAADAIPRDNLMDRLGMRTWNVVDFFSDENQARLLASQSETTITPRKAGIIKFSAAKPDADLEQANDKPPKLEEFIHLNAPLLLTIWDQQKSDAPLWFQFVEIAPISPFNQNDWQKSIREKPFQIADLLKKRNQFDDFELFSAYLPPSEPLAQYIDGSVSSCLLRFITESGSIPTAQLALEDAFADQRFLVPKSQNQRSIAMIDAMGIPNVVTMWIAGDQTATLHSEIRKDSFAGVKIDSAVWEPHRTGFLYNPELFESDRSPVLQRQKIYLRRKSEDPKNASRDLLLRFSLPFGKQNSPVKSREKFSYCWNRGEPVLLDNPTMRNHLIATNDFSFISAVKRHEYRAQNVVADADDIPLEIFSGSPQDIGNLIGNWSFTTANPNQNDSIQVSPPEIENIGTKVTVDFSQIEPYCLETRIGIDQSDRLTIDEQSGVFKSVGPHKYQFELRDLIKDLKLDFAGMIREKTAAGGGRITMTLFVEAVDFFGQKLQLERTISLIAPKPPRQPASPEKSTDKK